VAEYFQWVHTIDRLKIARRLSAQRPADAADLNVCIEVNIDEETSKSGVKTAEVAELAAAVADLPGLRLRGLMCLPARLCCRDSGRGDHSQDRHSNFRCQMMIRIDIRMGTELYGAKE
jgi:uncharacterized pyridoxal phosphate-containing UPF0001 family protein